MRPASASQPLVGPARWAAGHIGLAFHIGGGHPQGRRGADRAAEAADGQGTRGRAEHDAAGHGAQAAEALAGGAHRYALGTVISTVRRSKVSTEVGALRVTGAEGVTLHH